jgi:hypothetical protein
VQIISGSEAPKSSAEEAATSDVLAGCILNGFAARFVALGSKVLVIAMSWEDAATHFGWLSAFVGPNIPASVAQTQEMLAGYPTASCRADSPPTPESYP